MLGPRPLGGLFGVGLVATLLLGSIPVSAHSAAVAGEEYIRFLNDCSDDWGGHSAVRDGHDLVALDVTERWRTDWKEPGLFVMLTVGFGFAETGSQGGPLREQVELGLPGGPIKVQVSTADNVQYRADAAPGFRVPDVILPIRPSLLSNGNQDGSRVLIEFGFRYSTLGLQEGDKVTTAKVQAFARDDRGDYMPGGYYLAGVFYSDCPPSGHQGGGDAGTLYIRKDYALRGTERPYLSVRLDTDVIATKGNETATLTATLHNEFEKASQRVQADATVPDGWSVDASTPEGSDAGPQASLPIRFDFTPSGTPRNGSARILFDTSAGGHAERDIPLYWALNVVPIVPGKEDASETPMAPLTALLALVGGAAICFRRRS